MESLAFVLVNLLWAGVAVLAILSVRGRIVNLGKLETRVKSLENDLALSSVGMEALRKEVRAPMTRKVNF